MAIHYDLGEKKKRAGVYEHISNVGGVPIAGASNGVCSITVQADWGELGKVIIIDGSNEVTTKLGKAADTNTVGLVTELFNGGAKSVYAVRLGSGGTNGTVTIQAKADAEATEAKDITLTAKCAGTRKLSVGIKSDLVEAVKYFSVYEDLVEIEKIKFASGGNEAQALCDAGKASDYFNFSFAEEMPASIVDPMEVKEITVGTNPIEPTAEVYTQAFTLLEPYTWNTLNVDTEDEDIQKLAAKYLDRVWDEGQKAFFVLGIPTSVEYEERLAKSKAYNDKVVCCVVGTFDEGDKKYEGMEAAARVGGMIAKFPSESGLTHSVIKGATGVSEKLTNRQYIDAIENGAILFGVSQDGAVWIEEAITTFTTSNDQEDLGWSKIKRAKIRNELMDRASRTVAPMVAMVRNNPDGRAKVTKSLNRLLAEMVNDEKLEPGAIAYEDPDRPAEGDSGWWVIEAQDIDNLEKIYLHYKFKFSAQS